MKYVGSKNRISKEILPLMLKDSEGYINWIEPFVGGANLIDKVPNKLNKIGYDKHKYVIALLNALKDGKEFPNEISETEYYSVKNFPENYEDYYVGFVGFCCSFSGKWWGGYARGNTSSGFPRNYCLESKNNLLKQRKNILNVSFLEKDWEEIKFPTEKSIIYCDPPYRDTTKYLNEIDYDYFYNHLISVSKLGHKVYVSEYYMPWPFVCIFEKEVVSNLDLDTGAKKSVEKLYTLMD